VRRLFKRGHSFRRTGDRGFRLRIADYLEKVNDKQPQQTSSRDRDLHLQREGVSCTMRNADACLRERGGRWRGDLEGGAPRGGGYGYYDERERTLNSWEGLSRIFLFMGDCRNKSKIWQRYQCGAVAAGRRNIYPCDGNENPERDEEKGI